MRVIEPRQLPRPKKPHSKHWFTKWVAIGGVSLIVLYTGIFAIRYTRPLPALEPETRSLGVAPALTPLDLPIYGQVAAGAVGYGQLARAGDETPRPMASVAKVLTALVILEKKPLQVGQTGPVLTLDATDVGYYNEFISKDGSVVAVRAGEQITEYQALQALLLPSANNMADSLARWAYGSQEAFVVAANEYAASQGLRQTTMADASGFAPKTVSTAANLVRLGELAVKNAVITEIAAQPTATIPVAGEIKNVNTLLGKDGIDGIKTGNTDEAGGCFLATVLFKHPSGAQARLIVAVMGAGTRAQAMEDARALLAKITEDFGTATLKAGTVVGYYNAPWGGRIAAVLPKDVTVFRWQGTPARTEINMRNAIARDTESTEVGTIKLMAGPNSVESKVILGSSVPSANWRWRFWHSVAL